MAEPEILDITAYSKDYSLGKTLMIAKPAEPEVDINSPGLIMHGSEADPYTILNFGLVPQQTGKNSIECEWQVCLGLNAKGSRLTLRKDHTRKNAAVKYAGYFSRAGAAYIISDEIKGQKGYSEYWDQGEDARGYAWSPKAIKADHIIGVVTENVPLVAAAMAAAKRILPIYRPDGSCITVETLS